MPFKALEDHITRHKFSQDISLVVFTKSHKTQLLRPYPSVDLPSGGRPTMGPGTRQETGEFHDMVKHLC